jgi:hypothetical protein
MRKRHEEKVWGKGMRNGAGYANFKTTARTQASGESGVGICTNETQNKCFELYTELTCRMHMFYKCRYVCVHIYLSIYLDASMGDCWIRKVQKYIFPTKESKKQYGFL